MREEYEKEAKFLKKNYLAFLQDYLNELRNGTDPLHIHPPPAFRKVFRKILEHFVEKKSGTINGEDLIRALDLTTKFITYLHKNHISYDNFSKCSCTSLTDEDLAMLLESGGDNE